MKFIVPPQQEDRQNRNGPGGPVTPACPADFAITMCALCSEDPRFCDGEIY